MTLARRCAYAAVPLLILILLLQAAGGILYSPAFVWNEIRVARSVAMWHGFSLYLDKDAPGPIIGVLHTPVSHCVYLVLMAIRNPTYLILAGSLLSMLLLLAPLAWVLWRAAGGAGGRLFVSTAVWIFGGFLIMQAPGTFHTASMIHTDAAALAFATLACGIFSNPRRAMTAPQAWIAGFASVLAIGCKQTIAPIVLAIALFLAMATGGRLLLHYAASVCAAGALLFAAIVAFVPARAFFFNTVTLAAHRPLQPAPVDLLVRSFRDGKQDALPALFPILILAGCEWLGAARKPRLREFFLANRWITFALAAMVMLPVTAKAIVSVGADVNHLGIGLYLIFTAAALVIEQHLLSADNSLLHSIAWMCIVLAIAVSIAPGVLLTLPARLRNLHNNASEIAWRYEQHHPGRAYFPSNPLATLLSNGRVYHVDYAINDREIGGYPLAPAQFASGLPAGFQIVAYPPDTLPRAKAMRDLLGHYQRTDDSELPDWTVYQRITGQ